MALGEAATSHTAIASEHSIQGLGPPILFKEYIVEGRSVGLESFCRLDIPTRVMGEPFTVGTPTG